MSSALATSAPRDRDEERALFERWQRGREPAARAALVERYLPLARRLARRYAQGDEPLDDLVQVASLGLVKAVDRFDTARPVAFSSFAVPTILGELKRHFRDRTWSVRVPRDLARHLGRRFEQDLTQSEIGEAIGVSQMQVSRILRRCLGRMSAAAATARGPGGVGPGATG